MKMEPFKLMVKARAYTVHDRADVLEVFSSNIGLYFAEEETEDFIEFLDAQALDNRYLVFYSEDKPEQIIACGGHGFIDDKMFLRWGMVAQDAHNQGTGTQLLIQRLKAVYQHHGATDVYIDTSQHVQGFYEKFDFSVVSSIKDGFAPNIDRVRMIFNNWAANFVKPIA